MASDLHIFMLIYSLVSYVLQVGVTVMMTLQLPVKTEVKPYHMCDKNE